MVVFEHSVNLLSGGQSSSVAMSTVSAQSATFTFPNAPQGYVLVTPSADCFVRQGVNPTALSNGTDQILLAANTYRMFVESGNNIAFIMAAGSGTAYITPGG